MPTNQRLRQEAGFRGRSKLIGSGTFLRRCPGVESRWGCGGKGPGAENHDIHFALRITLVNAYAYRPFTYHNLYHHVFNFKKLDFQKVARYM